MRSEEVTLQAMYLCESVLTLAKNMTFNCKTVDKQINQLAANGKHEMAHITAVADSLLFNLRCHEVLAQGVDMPRLRM